jgi:hypothetical protein
VAVSLFLFCSTLTKSWPISSSFSRTFCRGSLEYSNSTHLIEETKGFVSSHFSLELVKYWMAGVLTKNYQHGFAGACQN